MLSFYRWAARKWPAGMRKKNVYLSTSFNSTFPTSSFFTGLARADFISHPVRLAMLGGRPVTAVLNNTLSNMFLLELLQLIVLNFLRTESAMRHPRIRNIMSLLQSSWKHRQTTITIRIEITCKYIGLLAPSQYQVAISPTGAGAVE